MKKRLLLVSVIVITLCVLVLIVSPYVLGPTIEECLPFPGQSCEPFYATETAKAPVPPAWWPFGP